MMRNGVVRGLLAGALAVGLIAAGCGDDDDDGTEASAITKEEWVTQADEICSEGSEAMEAEAEKFFAGGKPEKAAELEFQTEVVVPGIEQQVNDVAALPRPEGDEEEIEAIISAAREGLEEAKADPTVVEEEGGALGEAERRLADYGVTACA